MGDLLFDAQERLELCVLFDELGPSAPTLLEGWTAHDLAAHIVLRERDLIAAPCLVLPGPFQRFAERRRVRLANRHDFAWLVARIRSGPPPGFFRIGWVRSFPNLNEFFVHHEDVRRANGLGPRHPHADLEAALWRNVRRGGRYLSRRLRRAGLEIEWAGTGEPLTVRHGRAHRSTQRYARRTAPVRVRASGCRPGGGQRDPPKRWRRCIARTSVCESAGRRSGRYSSGRN